MCVCVCVCVYLCVCVCMCVCVLTNSANCCAKAAGLAVCGGEYTKGVGGIEVRRRIVISLAQGHAGV